MIRRWLGSWSSAGEDEVFTDSESDEGNMDTRRSSSPKMEYLLRKKQTAVDRLLEADKRACLTPTHSREGSSTGNLSSDGHSRKGSSTSQISLTSSQQEEDT
ncbi:hypothetical protein MAR_034007, partial [Mya arenaria]